MEFPTHETVHGTLVEVFGIGVMILGNSGVGKSEAALELIERGHRLVADDAVEIRCIHGNILLGAGANRALSLRATPALSEHSINTIFERSLVP